MLALLGDAQRDGAMLALASRVESAQRHDDGWALRVAGDEPFEMATRWLVNCAGLQAQRTALSFDGIAKHAVPRQYRAKGHYPKSSSYPDAGSPAGGLNGAMTGAIRSLT